MTCQRDPANPSFLKSPLTWVMAALFVVSAGWFAFLYVRGVEKDSMDMEFAKALLQVGIVSVAATLLSVLVFDQQRRSASRKEAAAAADKQLEFRDDVLKGTLGRITVTYNATKRARRMMRALGIRRKTGTTLVRLDRYDECMAEVNEAQLELEAVKSDVKTSRAAYHSADKLLSNLKSMEKYLGALIEEYESVRAGLADTDLKIPLTRVPRFEDFVGPSAGSEFFRRFSGAHDEARGAIRSDLLHLNLATLPERLP